MKRPSELAYQRLTTQERFVVGSDGQGAIEAVVGGRDAARAVTGRQAVAVVVTTSYTYSLTSPSWTDPTGTVWPFGSVRPVSCPFGS